MACEYCGCTSGHHLVGCPMEPAERYGRQRCRLCGEHILVGEEGYEINGQCYHYDCLDELTTDELVLLLTGEELAAFGGEAGA